MKKFLSVVLTSIVLILPMASVNCNAYEPQVLYRTPYTHSSGQQVPYRNVPNTSSKSSYTGSFFKFLSIAMGSVLLSTFLLKKFSSDGQFGVAVASVFNSIGNFCVGLKGSLWGICVEKDSNEKCTRYFSDSVNDFKIEVTSKFETLKNFLNNNDFTNNVTGYVNDVWGALVKNVNSFVNFNATQSTK